MSVCVCVLENAIAISINSIIDSEGLKKKMEMNKRDEKVGKWEKAKIDLADARWRRNKFSLTSN